MNDIIVSNHMDKSYSATPILLFIILFLSSCSSTDVSHMVQLDPIFMTPTIIPSGNEKYLNQNSDYIFDQENLRTYHLKISGEKLAEINANPSEEKYIDGMLIFEGDTISPVGIRYKGSIGAFRDCLGPYNPKDMNSREKTCTKLSMKVKINWLNKKKKFFNLKKLQFHSLNNDPSLMKERLGYWLFNKFGVETSRSVHAKLYINGKYNGIFALVEQIDGRFNRYHFDGDDGNLYKQLWPITPENTLHSDEVYLKHLKTNETQGDISKFKTFAQKVIDSYDQGTLNNCLEDNMDIDNLIRQIAVSLTIGRFDENAFVGVCEKGDCEGGNFYWYTEEHTDKVHLIPWDLDEITFDPLFELWKERANRCISGETNVYFTFHDIISCAFTKYYDEVLSASSTFKSQLYNSNIIQPQLEKWIKQIEPAVVEASELHSDAPSITTWKDEIENIKKW